jgi:hypothetical protein
MSMKFEDEASHQPKKSLLATTSTTSTTTTTHMDKRHGRGGVDDCCNNKYPDERKTVSHSRGAVSHHEPRGRLLACYPARVELASSSLGKRVQKHRSGVRHVQALHAVLKRDVQRLTAQEQFGVLDHQPAAFVAQR